MNKPEFLILVFLRAFSSFLCTIDSLGVITILLDVIKDTWIMLPLLYITYCILEFYERRPTENDDSMFYSLQKYGPLFGSLLGLIPQCGFSILAVMLFLQNNITLGTLVAVMIATSDEAIPILLANPQLYTSLFKLLACKFLIGIMVGYFVDKILFPKQKILLFDEMEENVDEEDEEESNNACPCCYTQYPLPLSALLRSLKIFGFIFVTTLIFNLGMEYFGSETLQKILLHDSLLQPFISALLGFIPNCAITVILAQLYAQNALSFGSLLSGLITNAGMGFICLVRYGGTKKQIIRTFSILYISAILFGVLFMII